MIVLTNHKGGTGKTTTVVNLGAALARKGKDVLLIDIDPQANTTTCLGYEPVDIDSTVYSVLFEGKNAKSTIIHTKIPKLNLLPSTPRMIVADEKLTGKQILKNKLGSVASEYDFVLIDTPPALNIVTINAMVASKWAIIPVQCHYMALRGLATMSSALEKIKRDDGINIDTLGVLLTMFDGRTKLSKSVKKEVSRVFGKKMFKTVIPSCIKLAQAPINSRTIFEEAPKSTGAEAYSSLADEVIRRS